MAQTTALLVILAFLAIALYRLLIFPIFLCPMRNVPTLHWTSRFSSLALLWKRYSGTENRTVHELHKRKGPILRLAPNVLSLNCFDGGLKQIYLGGFPKSDFYPKGFANYGTLPMFAMTNNKEHASRKRMFSNAFSKSTIITSESAREVTKALLFDRLLPLLKHKASRNEALDVVPLNFAYSMDSFVNWQFGLSSGSNLIQDEEEREMYLTGFFDRERYSFAEVEMPSLTWFLQKVGIRLIPEKVDIGTKNIEAWNLSMCDKAEALMRTEDQLPPIDYPSVFAHALRKIGKAYLDKLPGAYPGRNEIACEMFSHSSAAHETSGVTLTYLMCELSKRPELQSKLRSELMGLDEPLLYVPEKPIPSAKQLLELPLLDAIIQETLRLYPAVPGGQPRRTPSGSHTLGGIENIPSGVVVQCYAYSLHRNEEVFPEAEAWKPERWLQASPEKLIEMRRWFWAFGSGGSMCIGSNFAL